MKKSFILLTIIFISLTVQAQWTQLGTDFYGRIDEDHSGNTVSVSADGNTIAIGAPEYFTTREGYVHVYEWNGTNWIQKGSDIRGEAADDCLGVRVSLSDDGNTLAVGGYLNDGVGTDGGHVRIYGWDGTNWVQKGVDIEGEAAGDQFGAFVSINAAGNIVAISANLNAGAGTASGHVRVYEWDGTNWLQRGNDIDAEAAGDYTGDVSINALGNIVAVGAKFNGGTGAYAGHVRVFEWNGTNWVQKGGDIDGEAAGDQSGSSVSINAAGDIVVVGAWKNDGIGTDAGHVRVYEWNGSGWVQKGVDIDGEAAGDQSGRVSIDSSGNRVVVGAHGNEDGGSSAGHVRIYDWNGSSWVQKGTDIDGNIWDELGTAVSISDDGTTIVAGSPFSIAAGFNRGLVRVYRYSVPVNINENNSNINLSVYPNPTTGNLTIDLGGSYETAKIRIMDVTGREVFFKSYNTVNQLTLTLNEPAGVYFLGIEIEGRKEVVRLLKK